MIQARNISNSTITAGKLNWASIGSKHVYEDNGGIISNSFSGILGINVDVSGTYLVIGSFAGYDSTAGAYIQAKLKVGNTDYGATTTSVASGGRAQITTIAQITASAGDSIGLYGLCSSGSLNLSGRHNTLSIIRIS